MQLEVFRIADHRHPAATQLLQDAIVRNVWPIMALGLQVHAAQHVLKARVGAQRIKGRLHFDVS